MLAPLSARGAVLVEQDIIYEWMFYADYFTLRVISSHTYQYISSAGGSDNGDGGSDDM